MQQDLLLSYYFQCSDERGIFKGIINSGQWQEVNLVHTQANQLRGGHYHRQTTEVIFLLSGSASVELKEVDSPNQRSSLILAPGQGLQIQPRIAHWFQYHEDSIHIQLLNQKYDPSLQDLIPYDEH